MNGATARSSASIPPSSPTRFLFSSEVCTRMARTSAAASLLLSVGFLEPIRLRSHLSSLGAAAQKSAAASTSMSAQFSTMPSALPIAA